MTTSIEILMTKPNHKRVRIDVVDVPPSGDEVVVESHELDHGQVSETLNVWDGRQIRIVEID